MEDPGFGALTEYKHLGKGKRILRLCPRGEGGRGVFLFRFRCFFGSNTALPSALRRIRSVSEAQPRLYCPTVASPVKVSLFKFRVASFTCVVTRCFVCLRS